MALPPTTNHNISAGGNDTLAGGTNETGGGGDGSANETISITRELDTSIASDLAELEYDMGFLFHQNTTIIPFQNLTVHYLTATVIGSNGSNGLNETFLQCYLEGEEEGSTGSGMLVGNDTVTAVLSDVAQLILAG